MREQKHHKRISAALAIVWLFVVARALSGQQPSTAEGAWLPLGLGVLFVLGGAWVLWSSQRNDEQDKARQQDEQIALLQQMSAIVAHGLRNPLASAKGHSQLLAEMLEDGSRPQSKAAQVVQELTRVERLTNDLLTFIRSGEINRQSCELAVLMRDVSKQTREGALLLSIAASPAEWSLDAAAIELALLNLIQNALQAQGGTEPPVELCIRQEKEELYLSVRDHGPGPLDGLDIFAPFVTTKINGAGLGLTLSRQIIQAHRGRLSLQKYPGGGAIAEIYIPAA